MSTQRRRGAPCRDDSRKFKHGDATHVINVNTEWAYTRFSVRIPNHHFPTMGPWEDNLDFLRFTFFIHRM